MKLSMDYKWIHIGLPFSKRNIPINKLKVAQNMTYELLISERAHAHGIITQNDQSQEIILGID